jgi:uncharacterized LabA/DUF88 family protein
MANGANTSLAVLIDADNANPAIIEGLLGEIAKLGVASIKRIYGDWTSPQLTKWKALLLDHSIQPIQQFSYTTGKNATDSAMIIDAMDLLHTGDFGGFCLVSSDSDFTRLAARLREDGKRVYGFGEQKTPRPLVAACDRFIYTEIFMPDDEPSSAPTKRQPTKDLRRDGRLVNLVRSAINASSDEDGWATLGEVGSNINKQAPDFDPRNYGYGKLSDLVEAIGLFAVARHNVSVYVNESKAAPPPSR